MERFVNLLIGIFCLALLSGCSTVEIPKYIKDVNPYDQTFYASFQNTLDATTKALEHYGWEIIETAEPSMFEHSKAVDSPTTKQILLFSQVRQTGLFLGSRYQRLNVILRSVQDGRTDAELRYVTVSSIPFKSFTKYKKDAVAKRILDRIEYNLSNQ